MANQGSQSAQVDIANNTTIIPEFSTNQMNDEFVFNYARTTVINILREKMDVENDSRLFIMTLYMIQFIPDRNTREIFTTNFINKCKNKQGKLISNHKDSATTCVIASGIISDMFHAGNTSSNLSGCILPDYTDENLSNIEEIEDE